MSADCFFLSLTCATSLVKVRFTRLTSGTKTIHSKKIIQTFILNPTGSYINWLSSRLARYNTKQARIVRRVTSASAPVWQRRWQRGNDWREPPHGIRHTRHGAPHHSICGRPGLGFYQVRSKFLLKPKNKHTEVFFLGFRLNVYPISE